MEGGDYLRDTVRLVDSNEADTTWNVFHLLDEPLVVEPLRGAVYHPQLAPAQLLVDGLEFVPGLGRVYAVGRDAAPLEGIDLVLHEGDEWGDDYGDAGLAGFSEVTRLVLLGECYGWYLSMSSAGYPFHSYEKMHAYLVAQGLSSAGREDDEGILASQDAPDGSLLLVAEVVMAEFLSQDALC